MEGLVRGYERALFLTSSTIEARLRDAIDEHDRLAGRYNDLGATNTELTRAYRDLEASSAELLSARGAQGQEVEELRDALESTQLRRTAENAAAYEMVHQLDWVNDNSLASSPPATPSLRRSETPRRSATVPSSADSTAVSEGEHRQFRLKLSRLFHLAGPIKPGSIFSTHGTSRDGAA